MTKTIYKTDTREVIAIITDKANDVVMNGYSIQYNKGNVKGSKVHELGADAHDNTEVIDTTNTVDESQDYQPTCPRGYKDCVYDPAYIKYNYPEWYAKLYDSLSVEEASNQSCRLKVEEDPDEEYGCYDDEDK